MRYDLKDKGFESTNPLGKKSIDHRIFPSGRD
jgi:hypothetical protein